MDVPANSHHRVGFGLFEVDLSARELYRRGILVHIQDKPFAILAMLLEQPGEVITREELQKRLWPGDTILTSGYLAHTIRPRFGLRSILAGTRHPYGRLMESAFFGFQTGAARMVSM
jgi:DNA-binding winged helix-turn-helix (wHTH) protein